MNWLLSTVNLSTVPTFFVLRTAAQFLGRTKEKKRKEKKRKEKKRKEKKRKEKKRKEKKRKELLASV
jgi:prophage antirepressor-like protein